MQKALDGSQARTLEIIRNRIDGLGISEPVIYPGKDNTVLIQLPGIDEAKRAEAEDAIRRVAFLTFRIAHKRNAELVHQLFDKNKCPEGYKIARLSSDNCYVRDASFPDEKMDQAFRKRLGIIWAGRCERYGVRVHAPERQQR